MIPKKYRVTCLLAGSLATFIVLSSFAGKEKKEKHQRVAYDFPAAMSEPVRRQFLQECDRGQALYNLVCADCHDKKVDGRRVIPEWSASQLVGYELRVLNPKHEAGLPEEQVSAEELGYIMTFLSYKHKTTPVAK